MNKNYVKPSRKNIPSSSRDNFKHEIMTPKARKDIVITKTNKELSQISDASISNINNKSDNYNNNKISLNDLKSPIENIP